MNVCSTEMFNNILYNYSIRLIDCKYNRDIIEEEIIRYFRHHILDILKLFIKFSEYRFYVSWVGTGETTSVFYYFYDYNTENVYVLNLNGVIFHKVYQLLYQDL